jgi:hypothetical protein
MRIKIVALRAALMGTVINQAAAIFWIVANFIDLMFCTSPIPTTPPTRAWEVETGKPKREAIKMVMAVASSAQNPLLGSKEIIFIFKIHF